MVGVSSEKALDNYRLFGAAGIKSHVIETLKATGNPLFKDADYLGSNMNMLVETLAVMLQQVQFTFSLSTSEASWTNAQLFDSMSKLSALLGYRVSGKQTSMMPVRITVTKPYLTDGLTRLDRLEIPRFASVSHNSQYVFRDPVTVDLDGLEEGETVEVDAVLFQGRVQESVFTATGDEFERFLLKDASGSSVAGSFVTDGFFAVFVEEGPGNWREWTETLQIFRHGGGERVFERWFDEDCRYAFKFGNGVNGMRLQPDWRVAVFHLVSDGPQAVASSVLDARVPVPYASSLYSEILAAEGLDDGSAHIGYVKVTSTGPGTPVSYPESVESIRNNAPRAFASQNRLFTAGDYKSFIEAKFQAYVKGVLVFDNDFYTSRYLSYLVRMGAASPRGDSRVDLAQANFATSCCFNNVYAVVLPRIDTVSGYTRPNFVNDAIKREMTEAVAPYKGINHSLVPLDPRYRAFTFGSASIAGGDFNPAQLTTRLILKRDRSERVSPDTLAGLAAAAVGDYFAGLGLGDPVDTPTLAAAIAAVPGIAGFAVEDRDGNRSSQLTLYSWNPLYPNEDNSVGTQTLPVEPFDFCYFYNLGSIRNIIAVEDES